MNAAKTCAIYAAMRKSSAQLLIITVVGVAAMVSVTQMEMVMIIVPTSMKTVTGLSGRLKQMILLTPEYAQRVCKGFKVPRVIRETLEP